MHIRNRKKLVAILLFFVVAAILYGFVNSFGVERFVVSRLSEFLLRKYSMSVSIEDISFFNLSGEMSMGGISVRFRDSGASGDTPDLKIKRISISVGVVASLFRKITIKRLEVDSPEILLRVKNGEIVNIRFPESEKKKTGLSRIQNKLKEKGKELLPETGGLPAIGLKKFDVKNMRVYGTFNEKPFKIEGNLRASLSSRTSGTLRADLRKLDLPWLEVPGETPQSFELVVPEDHKKFLAKINYGDSQVKIEGRCKGKGGFSDLEGSGDLTFHIGKELSLPGSGVSPDVEIRGSAKVSYENGKIAFPMFSILGENLSNNYFNIDSMDLKGSVSNKKITISESRIRVGGAGVAVDAGISLTPGLGVQGKMRTVEGRLTLGEILRASHVEPIALDTLISGSVEFKGGLRQFRLELSPDLIAGKPVYTYGKNRKAAVSPLTVTGGVELTGEYVDFKPLFLKERGQEKPHRIEGKIVYSKGFEGVTALVDGLKLERITLSGLQSLSGVLTLDLGMSGPCRRPEGKVKIKLSEPRYGPFRLPELSGYLSSGGEEFNLRDGRFDFNGNEVFVSAGYSPRGYSIAGRSDNFKLKSISEMLGIGFLSNIQGDLSFNVKFINEGEHLVLNAKVSGKKFLLMGERIEEFSLDFKSERAGESGFIVKKGNGLLKITGTHRNGVLDYVLRSENLRLQDFNRLPRIVDAKIKIEGKLTGSRANPELVMEVFLVDTTVRGKRVPDSQIKLQFRDHVLEAKGFFMGENAKLEASFEKEKGLSGALRLRKFDFSPLLSIISTSYADARGLIDASLFVKNDSVQGMLNDLSLHKGESALRLVEKVTLSFQDNRVSLTPVLFKGNGMQVTLREVPPEGKKPDRFLLSSEIDLGLFYPLIPGVTHASGGVSYEAALAYDPGKGIIRKFHGEGKLKNVNLGLMALPQVVKKMQGSLFHDLRSFRVENIRGQFGGGDFTLGGAIHYGENFGSDVKLRLSNVTIRYRDDIQARVNSDLSLSGSRFPLKLKGNVEILRGLYTGNINYRSWVRGLLRGERKYSSRGIIDQTRFVDFNVKLSGRELLIKNNLAGAELKADMSLGGDNVQPVILGKIEGVNGFYMLKGRKYMIRKLTCSFDSEDVIDPYFNFESEADFRTHRVIVNVRGSMKGEIRANLSSSPPLTRKKILLLMSTGSVEGSDEDLAKAEAFDLFLEVEEVTGFAEKITGVDRIRILPGSYSGSSGKRGNFLLIAEKDLSDSMLLKFVSAEDFSAYRFNLDYYLTPKFRIEAGKETEDGQSSNSVDLIWEKSYK